MENTEVFDTNLIKNVFAIKVPKSFKTLGEQLAYVLTDEGYKENADKYTNEDLMSDKLINDLPDEIKIILGLQGESPIPTMYLGQPKYRDTSLGGNDAINCYPQFHEDDDIVPEINRIDNNGDIGLGRVYDEKIDRNQQILWLTFGVTRITDLTTFYTTSIDANLSRLMNKGDDYSIWDIGNLLGSITGFVATLPLQPFIFMGKLMSGLFKSKAVKYFSFKPTMPLYYRIVNTQIATLIVNMGLSNSEQDYEDTNAIIDEKFKGITSPTIEELNEDGKQENNTQSNQGLPSLFSTYGLDILRILMKREMYDKRKKVSDLQSLQKYLEDLKNFESNETNFFKDIVSGFLSGTYESLGFVGFRIEKSTDSSESLSNSVTLPSVANTVNSHAQSMRDKLNSTANFNLVGGVAGDVINKVKEGINGFINGTLGSVGVSGIFELIKGQGLIDFGEAWTDSSFNKSYNFKIPIRSIAGDKVSLAYRYIIFLMLLSGALPRAVGKNAYTSPFIVRGYCKGMFAIPLGIIDSISIKRGSDEYGWSVDRLPLNIDVSFTIKDLSPNMFLGLADSKSWIDILGQETSFSEYLMTLSGLSIKERLLFFNNIKRRTKLLTTLTRTVKFNPLLTGLRLSNNTAIGNIAMGLSPISKLPTR
jgi:hypothetical protein